MVQKKYCRWILIFVALAGAPAFTGCGRDGGAASDTYSVRLEMPEGSGEDSMLGIERQVLMVEGRHGNHQLNWSPGKREQVSFDEGQTLTYMGFDMRGKLVLTGSVRVGQEKRVSIPLRRM